MKSLDELERLARAAAVGPVSDYVMPETMPEAMIALIERLRRSEAVARAAEKLCLERDWDMFDAPVDVKELVDAVTAWKEPVDAHELVHGLRGTLDPDAPAWPGYRCDFCGRAPRDASDAYDWCPLSGDGWCCTDCPCMEKLNATGVATNVVVSKVPKT